MTSATAVRADRFDRPPVDKFEARRGELADAALQTLGELGYAHTSLREIAAKTAFSHGVLHYYFRDKVELITYCVRRYKEHCVTRYDEIVAEAATGEQLLGLFPEALVATLMEDTAMHRLWYDMRSQAMFEDKLQPTVTDLDAQLEDMIWRVVLAYAALVDGEPTMSKVMAYATFDGVFEQALTRHLAGDAQAGANLRQGAGQLLTMSVRNRA
ncbi:TetR/AcrR family transcriptional regulator [Leekyejoonella antrihumi]|uniref:TetR family transcriptional regulator n=1 Tax=Leekyejoonella antrihumi TaxID=1660198 RepID=A0A563E1Z8_9MICO|nr:TetR/AcrR family transcriptional regulator [Leekyejoonella antrihumi]TWP36212.1 TetR family transcriptional regulator [Leekyejoonella antrihumi]